MNLSLSRLAEMASVCDEIEEFEVSRQGLQTMKAFASVLGAK